MVRCVTITLAVAFTLALSLFSTEGATGRDAIPLILGLQAEISGNHAYSAETQQQIRTQFAAPGPTRCERCSQVGLAYPLPALLLALPTAGLDTQPAACTFMVLSVVIFAVALRLNGLSWMWLIAAPTFQATRAVNPSLLLVALLLIGYWSAQHERWWLVATCVALTIGAKPQTTLLLAGALSTLAIQAGKWKPLLATCGMVGAITLVLDPLWLFHWLEVIQNYRQVTTSAAPYPWLWWLLPLPAWLLWQRHIWPGLALLQVLLFPINIHSPYVTLPLIVGYAALPDWGQRWAWLPGWFFSPLGEAVNYLTATISTLLIPFSLIATQQERGRYDLA